MLLSPTLTTSLECPKYGKATLKGSNTSPPLGTIASPNCLPYKASGNSPTI